jgi:hypothetical protein
MELTIDVMHVLREPPRGQLIVGVGHERYRALSEIRDPIQRQRVLAAIGELVVFAGGYATLVRDGLAPPMPPADGPGPAPGALSVEPGLDMVRLEEEETDALTPLPVREEASQLLPEPPRETRSLVEQINWVVSAHVARNPELRGRVLRWEQDIKGGLHINLDGRLFSSPADLPDAQAKTLLLEALKEWEAL